jgi:surfeit locus 1 family protein
MDAARAPRSRGAFTALLAGAALLMLLFLALGAWQVQRLAWKLELIERVERHVNAAPAAAPGPAQWPTLNRRDDEYRRVQLQGRFDHARETLVAASTELGSGFWVLTPLSSDAGFTVLVNRGFVNPAHRDAARRDTPAPDGEQRVTGLLRFSEPGGSLLQQNAPAAGRWYSRDVAAIAAARGLSTNGTPLAPYFVDEAADPAAAADAAQRSRWPRPGLTVIRFSNNHRVYAVTWFALALMVACAIGYLVLDDRRLRRLSAPSDDAPDAAARSRRDDSSST